MIKKIMVVEDDLVLRETLEYRLAKEGYEVITAADGNDAVNLALAELPDLMLLDVMLPGIDGFEVCRILRRQLTMPILMLSARDEEVDRVVGLEVGADDYITKPFSLRELLARIKAQLRRVRIMQAEIDVSLPVADALPMTFGNLTIDTNRCEVTFERDVLALKPKEYDLLVSLAKHKGQALSREQLLKVVWGWEHGGNSRTVDVHVRWLREKIERDPAMPRRIVTVRGIGYRFEG